MVTSDPDFERVFAAEFASVARTVYLICHDRQRAEDIAQDAFVQLLRKWEKVHAFERPGAWVRRVAIRLAVKHIRREARRTGVERSSLDWAPTDAGDEGHDDVLDAVRRLPVRQRAAVVLFYYDDVPVDEVAALLGCSPQTARVHLHRARATLGRVLGEAVPDEPR